MNERTSGEPMLPELGGQPKPAHALRQRGVLPGAGWVAGDAPRLHHCVGEPELAAHDTPRVCAWRVELDLDACGDACEHE